MPLWSSNDPEREISLTVFVFSVQLPYSTLMYECYNMIVPKIEKCYYLYLVLLYVELSTVRNDFSLYIC